MRLEECREDGEWTLGILLQRLAVALCLSVCRSAYSDLAWHDEVPASISRSAFYLVLEGSSGWLHWNAYSFTSYTLTYYSSK